jgi:hypothetical protein
LILSVPVFLTGTNQYFNLVIINVLMGNKVIYRLCLKENSHLTE